MKKGKVETWGDHTFDEILEGRDPDIQRIARLARDLIRCTRPTITEVPWAKERSAGYGVGPKKMSEHYCYIAPQKAHVNLGFFYGADLDDPSGLLEGTGTSLRHIKLRSTADLKNPALLTLLRKASQHLPKLSG